MISGGAMRKKPEASERPPYLRRLLVELEGVVDGAGGVFDAGFVDGDGGLDLGGGDHADVDTGIAEGLEHLGGDAGMGAHADADAGELGDAALGFDGGVGAEFGEQRLEGCLGAAEIVRVQAAARGLSASRMGRPTTM